jgi:hypothetical protein
MSEKEDLIAWLGSLDVSDETWARLSSAIRHERLQDRSIEEGVLPGVERTSFPETSSAGTKGQGGMEGDGRKQAARESPGLASVSRRSGATLPEPSSAGAEAQRGVKGVADQESDHSNNGGGSSSCSISTNATSKDGTVSTLTDSHGDATSFATSRIDEVLEDTGGTAAQKLARKGSPNSSHSNENSPK